MEIGTSFKAAAAVDTPCSCPARTPKSAGSSNVISLQSAMFVRSSSSERVAADMGDGINRERVEEIKQAITQGRLVINPGAIADRLIASAQELLVARRH